MEKNLLETINDTYLGKPHKVILFNDESHSKQQVARQIVLAIHCSTNKALEIMLQAHSTGRAIVITAGLERCELVASILEDISLRIKIETA